MSTAVSTNPPAQSPPAPVQSQTSVPAESQPQPQSQIQTQTQTQTQPQSQQPQPQKLQTPVPVPVLVPAPTAVPTPTQTPVPAPQLQSGVPSAQPTQSQTAQPATAKQTAANKKAASNSVAMAASTMSTLAQPQQLNFGVPLGQPPQPTQFRFNNGALPNGAPQIYSAIYSGVDVYEMEVNNVAVMRRRHDSWLNATQILKVAKIDKGKRTKILEKEILTGEHEKVQGGYGKYQGTWVQFERGYDICRQYGVEELLRPLLTHDMGQDGGVAGRDVNTPTKEQAMAAQRKRMYNANAAMDGRQNGVTGTFFRNISSTASHAVAAISKARLDSPGPRNRSTAPSSRTTSFTRQPSMTQGDDNFPGNSQQSFVSDYSNGADTAYQTQPSTLDASNEPPRKRARPNLAPSESFSHNGVGDKSQSQAFPASPTEVNESFLYHGTGGSFDQSEGPGPLDPLPYEMSQEAEERKAQLLSLFLEHNISEAQISESIHGLTPRELDMPIDNQCHTVLHWASALSRMPLLRALISAGANPFRVNSVGQTALMRACTVTNSMELNTFPELLDVLGCTLEIRDHKGRTVLHQIAVTSAVKGRNAASRYYLESLLEWVVRQGSVPNSQVPQAASQSNGGAHGHLPKMGLARFMSEIVNAQDNSGDTALNIAAKNGNRSVISQLLEVGADPNIPNRSGLRPVDFGIGADASDGNLASTSNGTLKTQTLPSTQKNSESNDEIMSSISHILNEVTTDFYKDIKAKQVSVDSLHKEIRAASANLAESRRKLEAIQEQVRKQTHARQQIANLLHARNDEQFRAGREAAHRDDAISSWDAQIKAALADGADEGLLPPEDVLTTRIRALTERKEVMRKMVSALKSRSRETEVKYRKVVSLCTEMPVDEVDAVLDGLLRAVESEKSELELGRVRRFLGGVDGVVR